MMRPGAGGGPTTGKQNPDIGQAILTGTITAKTEPHTPHQPLTVVESVRFMANDLTVHSTLPHDLTNTGLALTVRPAITPPGNTP